MSIDAVFDGDYESAIIFDKNIYIKNENRSGVARGRAIGQLPNDSKVIAQGFFEMLPIAQCQKILIYMYVRRSKWCYRNTISLVMI
jgi:hypothetical protein